MYPHVLLIEDDRESRDMLALLLQSEGMYVTLALNGVDGLQALEAIQALPDIILLDLQMPLMSGQEFFTALKKTHADASRIPVVVLTGTNIVLPEAAATIRKPFHLDDLITAIHDTVSAHEGRRRAARKRAASQE
ncbi:MAG TPA: response regulator [Burkholderiales bacterium]|nr:response regulator [Burkholderiales bacterium]